ncbi:MAG: PhnD/SsuA/transferrin family substrate-binding protein, partial [Ancalomicrobiaceae bacterium]|nr:PhnD/SsuA/transferrin family substrate-binding protein [Ancalomicrobiaceae bacterium]
EDLLVSQTCGYPLVLGLNGAVRVLGAFNYAADGCDGALYRSYVVARSNEQYRTLQQFRGRRAAYNSADSHSGYNAFRALVAPMASHGRFFAGAIETGSHLNSIDYVLSGRADVAAIDCVVLQAVERDDPDLFSRLTIVTSTAPTPSLPLITHGSASDEQVALIRSALTEVAEDAGIAELRGRLMIDGFTPLEFSDYIGCIQMQHDALIAGYPVLA